MTILFLVRHAHYESQSAVPNQQAPLSVKGREQAERVARFLAHEDVTEIRCSPYQRARETAKILADSLGINPTVDENLAIGGRFDMPAIEAGTYVFVSHTEVIPTALGRAGVPCHDCGHASVWRLELDDKGNVTKFRYWRNEDLT